MLVRLLLKNVENQWLLAETQLGFWVPGVSNYNGGH